MLTKAFAIFLGGGLGSLCRWALVLAGKQWLGNFPIHTVLANFFASLILGLTIAYFANNIEKATITYSLIAIGFCGGFSTFSTFTAESFKLLENGNITLALLNIFVSISICLIAFGIGYWLVKS